ncbi:MAG TPA: hypothetical protein VE172_08145 [Stackebrandtia sp.]|jgi:hypothetical protein|uniref:hypothetical protein n=1 Tax=Stackebrandtia sp. TaxID=2023065 RepID=UPI002D32F12D|nr:hypothetical protein [Stackebrandtia sp.]HZE38769.1 hypothetical protein [Stackebrandtia sp.]
MVLWYVFGPFVVKDMSPMRTIDATYTTAQVVVPSSVSQGVVRCAGNSVSVDRIGSAMLHRQWYPALNSAYVHGTDPRAPNGCSDSPSSTMA